MENVPRISYSLLLTQKVLVCPDVHSIYSEIVDFVYFQIKKLAGDIIDFHRCIDATL